MTRFEKARILGTRVRQLSNNAPALVDPGDETDLLRIATKELKAGVLTISIRRYLGDGSHEDWSVNELKIRE